MVDGIKAVEGAGGLPETTVRPRSGQAKPPPQKSDSVSFVTAVGAVLSPGSYMGRSIAESGLSQESIALADRMGQIKEQGKGQGVRACIAEAMMSKAGLQTGGECSPTMLATIEEVGAGLGSSALNLVKGTAGSVLSVAFNTFASGLEFENNHKDAIKALAANGHPGMQYNEERDGMIKIRTWADATAAGLYPDDPKIVTYVSYDSLSGDSRDADQYRTENWRKLQRMEEHTGNQALESVHDFIAENGYEALQEKLEGAPEVMGRQHLQDLVEDAAYRQSIQAAPQERQVSHTVMP